MRESKSADEKGDALASVSPIRKSNGQVVCAGCGASWFSNMPGSSISFTAAGHINGMHGPAPVCSRCGQSLDLVAAVQVAEASATPPATPPVEGNAT